MVEKVDADSLESQQEEYPTRFKLIMTVIALMLSMFLVSEISDSGGFF